MTNGAVYPGETDRVERLVESALALLAAARAHGDDEIIRAAEVAAFLVGQTVAATLDPPPGDA